MSVPGIRLGLRENWAQFSLLVLVNAFVGGMVGLERSILPAIAEQEFAIAARTAIVSFIVAFGVTKAATNYLAGIGTAMVYPTLLAAIGDVTHPAWRASSVGVYRLWRDLGYAFGAVLSGMVADALGLSPAIAVVAALTFASGVLVAIRMNETLPSATSARIPQGVNARPKTSGLES